MAQVAARLTERRITLDVTDSAREWLANTAYDPAYGAAPLRRLVQSEVGDQLARMLLGGRVHDGDTVLVDHTGGEHLELSAWASDQLVDDGVTVEGVARTDAVVPGPFRSVESGAMRMVSMPVALGSFRICPLWPRPLYCGRGLLVVAVVSACTTIGESCPAFRSRPFPRPRLPLQ